MQGTRTPAASPPKPAPLVHEARPSVFQQASHEDDEDDEETTPDADSSGCNFGNSESVRVDKTFMSEKSKRIGVPGGRQIDPRHTWQELFSWRGGALKVAATSISTYIHVLMYLLLCVVATVIYDHGVESDEDAELQLAFATMSIDGPTVSAIAFLVSFSLARYVGFVVGRYNERFNHCCACNGAQTMLAFDAASMIPPHDRKAAKAAVQLMRRGLLLQHLLYMGIDGRPLGDKEYALLRQRSLLSEGEQATLAMERNHVMHVYVWAARDVYDLKRREAMLRTRWRSHRGPQVRLLTRHRPRTGRCRPRAAPGPQASAIVGQSAAWSHGRGRAKGPSFTTQARGDHGAAVGAADRPPRRHPRGRQAARVPPDAAADAVLPLHMHPRAGVPDLVATSDARACCLHRECATRLSAWKTTATARPALPIISPCSALCSISCRQAGACTSTFS